MNGSGALQRLRAIPNRMGSTVAAVRLAVAVGLVLGLQALTDVRAQQPKTDPPSAPPAAADQSSDQSSGFFSAIGQWIDTSISAATATLKGTRQATEAVGNAAKGTVDQLSNLGNAKIVTGHELCAAGATGTPDCSTAVDAMCRRKGWAARTTLDIQTEQKCPPQVWITGRPPAEGECRNESYVLRAVCQ